MIRAPPALRELGTLGPRAVEVGVTGRLPFTGSVFVFFNRARDRIKLLLWDRNGFWLYYKRLEKGTFDFDLRGAGPRVEVSRAQLAMVLEGIDIKSAKLRPHFSEPVRIMGRQGDDRGQGHQQAAES